MECVGISGSMVSDEAGHAATAGVHLAQPTNHKDSSYIKFSPPLHVAIGISVHGIRILRSLYNGRYGMQMKLKRFHQYTSTICTREYLFYGSRRCGDENRLAMVVSLESHQLSSSSFLTNASLTIYKLHLHAD
ncbi:hypothetical protein CBL_12370 [Carabus blaptoides fortunei]